MPSKPAMFQSSLQCPGARWRERSEASSRLQVPTNARRTQPTHVGPSQQPPPSPFSAPSGLPPACVRWWCRGGMCVSVHVCRFKSKLKRKTKKMWQLWTKAGTSGNEWRGHHGRAGGPSRQANLPRRMVQGLLQGWQLRRPLFQSLQGEKQGFDIQHKLFFSFFPLLLLLPLNPILAEPWQN